MTDRLEMELAEHVRKALSPDESAPKQKHVRSIIVFCYDHRTSQPFWHALKLQPVLSDDVQCYKALITIHKLLSGGPTTVLREALRERAFLDACARHVQSHSGYGELIAAYVHFLKCKLSFHEVHSEFTGNFDYDDFVSLKRIDDPNEGYTTISELMDVQDEVLRFQSTVFGHFRPHVNNECRIAGLVPLVEESFGIYTFLTQMLTALFNSISSPEALLPLLDRYNQEFRSLQNFYDECRNVRYLTSLISIPTLPQEPPQLIEPTKVQRLQQQSAPPVVNNSTLTSTTSTSRMETTWATQYSEPDLLNAQQTEQLRQEAFQYRLALEREQHTLQQYQQRCQQLEQQMQQMSLYHQMTQQQLSAVSANAANAANQPNEWRQKYESMQQLYANLRQEHVSLLAKYKAQMEQVEKAKEWERKFQSMQEEMRRQQQTVTLLKADLEKQTITSHEQIAQLRRQLAEAGNSSNTNNQQSKLLLQSLQDEVYQLQQQLNVKEQESYQQRDALAVSQAGLDQALLALNQLQEQQQQQQSSSVVSMNYLLVADKLLANGARRLDQSALSLDQPAGNHPLFTSAYVLALSEPLQESWQQLATSLTGLHASPSTAPSVDHFLDPVEQLTQFLEAAHSLAGSEESFLAPLRHLAHSARTALDQVQSERLSILNLPPNEVIPSAVNQVTQALVQAIQPLESKDTIHDASADLGAALEREMSAAARAIEAAAERLEALLASNQKDTQQSPTQLQVHAAILDAGLAITSAIGQLIKCATQQQHELVQLGRVKSGLSSQQFYKKHSRWSDGLISAARAVAAATGLLVERADGAISGKHSFEELCVASRQVTAATAQLVAASRVNNAGVESSRSQLALEGAAKSVGEAVRRLVAAAEQFKPNEEKNNDSLQWQRMNPSQFRVLEMDQQVHIMTLEKQLTDARRQLSEMRRVGYHRNSE